MKAGSSVNGAVITPQLLEQLVLESNDPSNPQAQWRATCSLKDWTRDTDRQHAISLLFQILEQSSQEPVRFYALSTLGRVALNVSERASLRQYLLYQLPPQTVVYLLNKVAWLLARLLWEDVPAHWSNLEEDLVDGLSIRQPGLFCKVLDTLFEEFSVASQGTESDELSEGSSAIHATKEDIRRVKDYLKGYTDKFGTATGHHQQVAMGLRASNPPSLLDILFGQLLKILEKSVASSQNGNLVTENVLWALQAMKRFFLWIDAAAIFDPSAGNGPSKPLQLMIHILSASSYPAPIRIATLQLLKEWSSSANDWDGLSTNHSYKISVFGSIFEQIHNVNLLPYIGESHAEIEIVIEVANFVNSSALITFACWEAEQLDRQMREDPQSNPHLQSIFCQCLDLFFRAYAYDDIDVSAAVLPFAGKLTTAFADYNQLKVHFPQLLTTLYQQMKYPVDFSYDYEDEIVAEEMAYRTDLSKLFGKMVRVDSEICLQFVVEAAQQLGTMSKAPAPDVEAFLRLLFHYCEGIRPPPGLKTVIKNESFRMVLNALHESDIMDHPHQEVLCLYYDVAVRYHPVFIVGSGKSKSANRPVLSKTLDGISGTRGLQHHHVRVRSRCCYLLLRLVKETSAVMKPFVETAVDGIHGLLSNEQFRSHLRSDDTFYLFETMGILLGKTGISAEHQRDYLIKIIGPHVHFLRKNLTVVNGGEFEKQMEELFANSIAAIAHLSKGFAHPPEEAKVVLVETLQVATDVLAKCGTSEAIRNKVMVFLQRMIIVVDKAVLAYMPVFLDALTTYCTPEDLIFVAQIFNKLCMKFKVESIPIIDNAFLPLLRKCINLLPHEEEIAHGVGADRVVPPHIAAERLAIEKVVFSILQNVSSNGTSAILVSPVNVGSLESTLQIACSGASGCADLVARKTCLRVFRELCAAWLDNASFQTWQQGLLQFCHGTLFPAMVRSFLQKAFDEQDAQSSKILHEFAQVVFVVKSFTGQSAATRDSLKGSFEAHIGRPLPIIEFDLIGSTDEASIVQTWLNDMLGKYKRQDPKYDVLC